MKIWGPLQVWHRRAFTTGSARKVSLDPQPPVTYSDSTPLSDPCRRGSAYLTCVLGLVRDLRRHSSYCAAATSSESRNWPVTWRSVKRSNPLTGAPSSFRTHRLLTSLNVRRIGPGPP